VGDVTDCLSAAYECVSRLIGEKPVSSEIQEWPGLEERRKAEDQGMPWLTVDLGESDRFVYALASVPGYLGRNVLIGLEPGWLAVLAQREKGDARTKCHAGGRPGATGCVRMPDNESSEVADTNPEQTFCVMSLPVEVNPVHSIAILAKGILGIRMPKARGE
jgi:HSP20 family molecular chaperone IbpA